MLTFRIEDFADDGIIREESFRDKIKNHDWPQYEEQVVLMQGCSNIIIPQWALLMAAIQLSHHAKRVSFGEPKTQYLIYRKADLQEE